MCIQSWNVDNRPNGSIFKLSDALSFGLSLTSVLSTIAFYPLETF
jgi:hypothetical protein